MTSAKHAVIVAVIGSTFYVVASGVLIYFAITNSIGETSWARAITIFNGIASIGFACVGVLLGNTVQLVNLNAAKADIKKKDDAMKNAMDALADQQIKHDSAFLDEITDAKASGQLRSQLSGNQRAYQILSRATG